MKFLQGKFDKRLPIYAVLCFFVFTALFCFVQFDPLEFEDAEVNLPKLELFGFASLAFASLFSSICVQYFYSCPHKSLVVNTSPSA